MLALASRPLIAADLPSQSFTYQGKFFNSSGTAPLTSVVDLVLEIYSPTSDGTAANDCLLYAEKHSAIDLSLTGGMFSVQVGSSVGAPKRLAIANGDSKDDPGLTMAQIFSNKAVAVRAPLSAECMPGYTPVSGEARRFRVTVIDGGVPTVLTPDQVINAVPHATNAETLQGVDLSNLIQASGSVTQSNLTKVTDGSDISALGLHSHDNAYLKSASSTNQNLGSGTLYSTGKIGIGTSAPSASFEIVGPTGAAFRLADGNQGNGKILVSDATGNATWQTAASLVGATGASGADGSSGSTGASGAQGVSGATGASGAQGSSGATGASGAQGSSGATGASGAQGDVGATGASGAQGNSGATGASGANGAIGNTGASGATGAAGAQGNSGATGATGDAGAMGFTGASGATGAQGSVGSSGATGASGAQGSSGATGVSGAQGDVGATGASGAQGNSGATGASGSQGMSGATGASGTDGAVGNTGASGAQGLSGATGASGTDGAVGNTGASGAQGMSGATGASGANGAIGNTGASGAQGMSGATGVSGTDGAVGNTGASGATGAAGAQGNSGATGASGTDGAIGNTGASGAQGMSGATGASGANGAIGNTGASGAQGMSGATGVSGTDGAVGNTGATGAAGAQGNSGATGTTGDAGAMGFTGTSGATGAQGAQGMSGATGASGTDGAVGNTGASGAQGLSGATGASGANGAIGNTGASGAQGMSGATGASGTDGAVGNTGASGATGAAGAQGYSGATGATGDAGAMGFTGATGAAGAQGASGATGAQGAIGNSGASGATGAGGAQGMSGATGAGGAQGMSGATGAGGAQGMSGATGASGAQGSSGVTGATGDAGAQGTSGATGATGASPFGLSGSIAYYTAGNVGIGTTAPGFQLEVTSQTKLNSLTVGSNITTTASLPGFGVNHSDGTGFMGAINAAIGAGTQGALQGGVYTNSNTSDKYGLMTLARNNTGWYPGSLGALVNGDYLAGIGFAGQTDTSPSTGMHVGASIIPQVDGTVASGALPTALTFRTTTTNNTALAERMRITSSGNVGVGTTGPGSRLEVVGSNGSGVVGSFWGSSGADGYVHVNSPHSAGRAGFMLNGRGGAGVNSWILQTGGTDQNLYLHAGNNVNSSPVVATVTNSGKVGFGTTAPASTLSIRKDLSAAGDGVTIQTAASGVAANWYGPSILGQNSRGTVAAPLDNGDADILLGLSGKSYGSSGWQDAASIRLLSDGAPGFLSSPGRIEFLTTPSGSNATVSRMVIKNTGEVGIGTSTPGATLHVVGPTGAALRLADGTQGAGRFLTSDASGNASWTTLSAGPSGATGATGAQGAQGQSGSTGANGASGVTGATGTDGAQGLTGATGADGTQGATGASGAQGASGATGSTGASPFGLNAADAYYMDGKVGIGTSAPATTLHVVGDIRYQKSGAVNTITLSDYQGSQPNIKLSGSDSSVPTNISSQGPLRLFAGNTDLSSAAAKLLIAGTTAGNVGIGTSSPGAQLEVDTNSTGTIGLKVWGMNGQTAYLQSWGIPSNGTMMYLAANGELRNFGSIYGFGINSADGGGYTGINLDGNNRSIKLTVPGSSTADTRLYRSSANTLTLDDNSGGAGNLNVMGRLGIGTTGPTGTLHVAGPTGAAFVLVDGTQGAGKVLTSDVNGFASWSSPSVLAGATGATGASPFLLNGSSAYYNSGNVGVGTSTPAVGIHILQGQDVPMRIETTGTYAPGFDLWTSGTRKGTFGIVNVANQFVNGSAVNDFVFRPDAGGNFIFGKSDESLQLFKIMNSGNVGIGTTAPSSKLEVNGDVKLTASATAGTVRTISINGTSAYNNLRLTANTDGQGGTAASMDLGGGAFSGGSVSITAGQGAVTNGGPGNVTITAGNTTNPTGGAVSLAGGNSGNNVGGNVYLVGGAGGTTPGNVILGSTSSGTLRGYVGVGTTSPAATFHVAGPTGAAFRLADGNQGAGKFLSSDASGNATWTALSAGPSGATGASGAAGLTGATGASPFIVSGSDAYYTAGNIGIGTSSPQDPLSFGVTPAANSNNALINLTNNALGASANGTYIGANPASVGADFLSYNVGGQGRFWVGRRGNVSISDGGTSAADVLTVSSTSVSSSTRLVNLTPTFNGGSTLGTGLQLLATDSTTGTGSFRGIYLNTGTLSAATGEKTLMRLDANSVPVMTVQAGGNVGIGTSSPTTPLYVKKTGTGTSAIFEANCSGCSSSLNVFNAASTTGNSASELYLSVGSSGNAYGGLAGISTSAIDGALAFKTNTAGAFTEKARFNHLGNLGIGTTTPAYPLSVYRATAGTTSNVESGNAGSVAQDRYAGLTAGSSAQIYGAGLNISDGSGGYEVYDYTAGASRMFINTSGNVGVGTTGPASKLTVAGTIESTSGGVKFPDGTTQTSALGAHLLVVDEKTAGTPGGSSVAGTWTTRTLNTVKFNAITGASLASNQLTLPAGTYHVRGRAPAYFSGRHQAVLYSVTDTANLLTGTSSLTGTTNGDQTVSEIEGQITLTGTTVLEIRHNCASSAVTTGFGSAANLGVTETFSTLYVQKIQ